MSQLLPHLTVETNSNPDASVIWLHGLGADGNDFKPIVSELGLPDDAKIRFIFPHSPSRPVTINGGMVMPAWYDILEMTIERSVDEIQLRESAQSITDFIEDEISKRIASERIIIAGFSQGGAVAVETALSFNKKLAGLLMMSTYFATKDSINFASENQSIPIEIHHGTHDPVVPVQLSEVSTTKLKENGYSVEMKHYPMEHSVCPKQIKDIGQWLTSCLK
ncbi:MAG: carboxylesterase [Gammaproteobacteria bacterium]|nr:dienelactone hydrolase family protein [Paracoccaceae bacterium]PCI65017.1 MAG: carboxylesterase [Gammaproteobacteria bacterium]